MMVCWPASWSAMSSYYKKELIRTIPKLSHYVSTTLEASKFCKTEWIFHQSSFTHRFASSIRSSIKFMENPSILQICTVSERVIEPWKCNKPRAKNCQDRSGVCAFRWVGRVGLRRQWRRIVHTTHRPSNYLRLRQVRSTVPLPLLSRQAHEFEKIGSQPSATASQLPLMNSWHTQKISG